MKRKKEEKILLCNTARTTTKTTATTTKNDRSRLQHSIIHDDNKHNKDRNDISSPSTTTIVATRLRGHDIIFVDSTKFVVDNNHKTTNEPKTPVTRKRFHRCHDNKRRIQQLQPWLTDDVRRNNNNHIFQHDWEQNITINETTTRHRRRRHPRCRDLDNTGNLNLTTTTTSTTQLERERGKAKETNQRQHWNERHDLTINY